MAAAGPPPSRPRTCQWEMGKPKMCYPNRKRAERAIASMKREGYEGASLLEAYRCRLHGYETPVWHVGHAREDRA